MRPARSRQRVDLHVAPTGDVGRSGRGHPKTAAGRQASRPFSKPSPIPNIPNTRASPSGTRAATAKPSIPTQSMNAKQSSGSPPSPNAAQQEKPPKPGNHADKAAVRTRLRSVPAPVISAHHDGDEWSAAFVGPGKDRERQQSSGSRRFADARQVAVTCQSDLADTFGEADILLRRIGTGLAGCPPLIRLDFVCPRRQLLRLKHRFGQIAQM